MSDVLCADDPSPPLQIGQLLASISGEKPTASSALPPARLSKRKADDDAPASGSKLQRTTTPTPASGGSARPVTDAPKPSRPADRSSTGYTGSARPSSSTSAPRPLAEKSASFASKRPALSLNGKSSPTSASFANTNKSGPSSSSFPTKRPAGALATPAAASQTATSDSAKAPKKGSIAEIRARAAAQQEKLQAIGKIQHKATEKPLTKKEREEAAAEELRLQKKGLKSGSKSATGLLTKHGSNGLQRSGNGHIDRERGAIQKASSSSRPGKSATVEEPKRKKAASATTGYTGSARPAVNKAKPRSGKPGPSNGGRDQGRDRRPNPMGMFSKPRRRDEDDYDEDMDDFVVDDEEEEEEYGYGSRYRYADEDDDSDMEAGFSDVEDEEAAATRMAILDDKREQQLEEQLRREKEARKRRLLAGRR